MKYVTVKNTEVTDSEKYTKFSTSVGLRLFLSRSAMPGVTRYRPHRPSVRLSQAGTLCDDKWT